MVLPLINSIELKHSKSGHVIPCINGVHLHSTYDPEKEAQGFVEKNLKILEEKNHILILGLGLGYHVKACVDYYGVQNKKAKIMVIEPFVNLEDIIEENNLLDTKSISIVAGKDIDELYQSEEFINFLLTGPGVLAYPPSFNLFKPYFSAVLAYTAPEKLNSMPADYLSRQLTAYLNSFGVDATVKDILGQLGKAKNLNVSEDYFMMAFKSLSQQTGDPTDGANV